MAKFARLLIVLFGLFSFLGSAYAGDWETMQIFTEPPQRPYKEIGMVEESSPLSQHEFIIVNSIAHILKKKAYNLGADAIIIESIDRIPHVFKEHLNYDTDPLKYSYGLSIHLQIKAKAIKFE